MTTVLLFLFFFFFNDTATTEIYTLSLHDALPISLCQLELIGDRTPPQHRPLDQHPEQRRVDALASGKAPAGGFLESVAHHLDPHRGPHEKRHSDEHGGAAAHPLARGLTAAHKPEWTGGTAMGGAPD